MSEKGTDSKNMKADVKSSDVTLRDQQEEYKIYPCAAKRTSIRKNASLDRQNKYSTLSGSGARIGVTSLKPHVCRTRSRNPMLDRKFRFSTICGADLKRSFILRQCPLENGLDFSLAPWPGMKFVCLRVLHLYCKVFDQIELFELIVR